MQPGPRDTITPFVFSDPAGKRWPRLRLILLIIAICRFHRDRSLCADAFCRAATASAVFAATVEGPAEIAAEKKPGRPGAGAEPRFGRNSELARHAAKKPVAAAFAPGASAQEICRQRSAARFLHQRRSLQLRFARATRGADHACLSGMDGGGQWSRRLADRRRQPIAQTRGEQRSRA